MTDTTTPLASYPRINPAFAVVVESDDAVTFTAGPWSGPVFDVEDDDGEGVLAEFVAALDGTTHVHDVLDAFDPAVRAGLRDVLAALQAKSIVRDAGRPVSGDRARVGGYLALDGDGRDRERELSTATVAVLAGGTTGRAFARALLDSGVGAVEYVPLDPGIESSGEPAEADPSGTRGADGVVGSARVTHRIDPDLRALLGDATFAAMAVDRPRPAIASTLNEAAHGAGTPWTLGVVNGVDAQVGPTVYPGETACYECFRARADAATGAAYTSYEAAAADRSHAGVPAFATTVAGLLAADVVEQVTGGFGVTTGSVVDVAFDEFAVQADDVLRLPHCGTCGRDADRLDAPRHVTVDHLARGATEADR